MPKQIAEFRPVDSSERFIYFYSRTTSSTKGRYQNTMRPTLTQVHLLGSIGIRCITLCMSELLVN